MQAIFNVQSPSTGRFEFTVSLETPMVIGRGSQANVRVDDPGLSRRHCRVTLTSQGLVIQDLDSSNGTYVNGQRIATHYLRPGDEIHIGQTVMHPFPVGANATPKPTVNHNPYNSNAGRAMSPAAPNQASAYGQAGMGAPHHSGEMQLGSSGEMAGGYGMPRNQQQGYNQAGYGNNPMPPGAQNGQAGAMGGRYAHDSNYGGMPGQSSNMPGLMPTSNQQMNQMGRHAGMPGGQRPNANMGGHPGMGMRPQMGGHQQGMGHMGQNMGHMGHNMGRNMPGMARPGARLPGVASRTPAPAKLDPSMIACSRCGCHFKGTRAQIHWRDKKGDPSLLVCEPCKDLEQMANNKVHGYELLEVLGKGAMGVVYKARRQSMNDIVALKIVNLEGDPNGLKNFIREARTGASVQHPNSVRTLEMGESSGKFYLAMEFVEGQTLEDLVKKHGTIDQQIVWKMAYVLLDTLEAARVAHVVHRDLKPANILVMNNWEPKITDFGLAKLITDAGRSGLTAPGDLRGTPMFMPPEQLEDASTVDHRADLYALGATLYNALTDSYPFKVKTLRDLCLALENEDPTPVCKQNPAVSEHFSRFIERLMAKKPADRFQSAKEAQVELQRVREKMMTR